MSDWNSQADILCDRGFGFWLRRAARAHVDLFAWIVNRAKLGLTPEQFPIIAALLARDGQSQSQLCEATSRSGPTLSRLLYELECMDSIVRRRGEGDTRIKQVFLNRSELGHERASEVIAEAAATMLRDVEPSDLEATVRTLRRVFHNIETARKVDAVGFTARWHPDD